MSKLQSVCQQYYEEHDRNDEYERQWGYSNPIAASYWRVRDELVFAAVRKHFRGRYESCRVLEVGVGHGHELAKFAQLGISPTRLVGVDLMFHRLVKAKSMYPAVWYSQQDGTRLAFSDNAFDIVCQFTCVMHAESKDQQRTCCKEMSRVLKPGGIVIWWDMTPPTWRVILFKRLCDSLSGGRRWRQLLSDVKQTFREAMSPSYRRQKLACALPPYLLPISRFELLDWFPGLKVLAVNAGLDYGIWELLWRRSRWLATILWRTGFLSHHCFAVVLKT